MANSIYQQSYLSYVAEVTPGTTPDTPTMKKLRTTNPLGVTANKTILESSEVLAHRQREHVRHGVRGFSGSVGSELSFGAYNDWLEALLGGTWSTGTLKAGSTVRTFTVEQRIASNKFIVGKGVTPSQLSLSMNPTGVIGANWEMVGMDFDDSTTTLGVPTDVATHPPFDGLGNAVILEGGNPIAIATSIEMTINANKTVGALLGSNAGDVPSDGQLQITGTMTARFNSMDLFKKFADETESSLKITFTNPGGADTLAIELPRIKYTGGAPQNNDNVIDVSLPFEGLYDESSASSIIITEVEA